MKYFLLFLFAIVASTSSNAQITIKGVVFDSLTQVPLNPVSIENLQTHQGVTSNTDGTFSIEASIGDYIIFTQIGYNRKVVKLKASDNFSNIKVGMTLKTTSLKEVTIKRGPTEYQKDSLNRAEIYKDAFDYQQQKSAFSPITSIYQKFSKKYKNLRKFQDQIIDMEQQKFIDTRYTPELVNALTKLVDEELASFINQYPMEFDYARTASELEIKMWIKYNFQDYIKKGRPPFVPAVKK